MKNKWIVLLGDIDSGTWTVVVNSKSKTVAEDEFKSNKQDGTPAILLYTGDFVQV